MKQVLFSTGKAFLALALFATLSSEVHAQATPMGNNEVPGAVRYTGIKDNMLYFDVNVPAQPSGTVLRIVNEDGEVLHQEHTRAGALNRRFAVPLNLCAKLRFEVAGKTVRLKQTFDIARKLEERVVVTASL